MSLTNLSKWVPVEGAFGAVASSGPFDSIYNLILNSSLENPTGLQGGNWEFFESKTFETTTAFIVKTPPSPFTITQNGVSFEFNSILRNFTDEEEKFYAVWTNNNQYYISGPSNYLVLFNHLDGYCIFDSNDIPNTTTSQEVLYDFNDFISFVNSNIYPQYETIRNTTSLSGYGGKLAAYYNQIQNFCANWLDGYKARNDGVNPASYSHLASDFLDLMWDMEAIKTSNNPTNLEPVFNYNMIGFSQAFYHLYGDWSLQIKPINKRIVDKFYDANKNQYRIKNYINIDVPKYTDEEINTVRWICTDEVNGEWIFGDITEERNVDMTTQQWGLGAGSREFEVALGMLDLLQVIKKEPRILGGSMAALWGENEEPEGEGFGEGGDDVFAADYPILRFTQTYTYSSKKYEIWQTNRDEYSIYIYENHEAIDYIIYAIKYNTLNKAKEKVDELSLKIFDGSIEIRDAFQNPSVLYQRETANKKYIINLTATGLISTGIRLAIQQYEIQTPISPTTLEAEVIELQEIIDAKSFEEMLEIKNNLPEKILQKWRSLVDDYISIYNSSNGGNESETYDPFYSDTDNIFKMFNQTLDFAIPAIKNCLIGAVLGILLAAPFVILIWSGYFIIVYFSKIGGI